MVATAPHAAEDHTDHLYVTAVMPWDVTKTRGFID